MRAASYQDSGTEQAMNLVHRIRGRYLPAAGFAGAQIYVTGAPAFGVDFIAKAYGAFPWLIAAVLVIRYLVLLRAFRSVVLPVKAVLMNLLSVAASYGVLVLFFQHGLGNTLLGLKSSPQIEGWIPVFLFAVLFGLSMDYEVFLLSRMREEYDRTGNNATAVADGLAATARVITAAALIMIFVFSAFVLGDDRAIKLFGFGLAIAVFLDATIVRLILVPATMELLGDWNWWIPKWLDRILPRIHIEGHPDLDAELAELTAREGAPTA